MVASWERGGRSTDAQDTAIGRVSDDDDAYTYSTCIYTYMYMSFYGILQFIIYPISLKMNP